MNYRRIVFTAVLMILASINVGCKTARPVNWEQCLAVAVPGAEYSAVKHACGQPYSEKFVLGVGQVSFNNKEGEGFITLVIEDGKVLRLK